MSAAAAASEKRAIDFAERARAALKRFAVENAAGLHQVEAMEWLDAAARSYVVGGRPDKAAECYGRCADLTRQLGEPRAAAAFWVLCGELRGSYDPSAALDAYDHAVELECSARDWSAAAVAATRAENWSLASDLFAAAAESDELCGPARAECLAEAATAAAVKTGDFGRAARAFELLASEASRDNLAALNCPRLLFKATLGHLVSSDLDLAAGKMHVFDDVDASWKFATERKFLADLIQCLRGEPLPDLHVFADAAFAFAQVRHLDEFDLLALQRLHDRVQRAHDEDRKARDKARRKAERQRKKEQDERDRLARIERDRTPASRGT